MTKAPKRTSSAISTAAKRKRYTRTGTELMDYEAGSVHRKTNLFGSLAGTGIPQRMFPVKHRRVLSASLDPADGTPVTLLSGTISLNNLAATIAARQPMAYDQFNQLYERFRVTKVKLTAHFQAIGNSGTADNLMAGIQFTENSSWSPSDVETLLERGFAKFKPLGLSNGFNSCVTVKKTWELAKWYGPENSKGLSVTGTNSVAPTEEVHAAVFLANGSTNNSSGAWVTLIMDYEVEWFGPKQLDVST